MTKSQTSGRTGQWWDPSGGSGRKAMGICCGISRREGRIRVCSASDKIYVDGKRRRMLSISVSLYTYLCRMLRMLRILISSFGSEFPLGPGSTSPSVCARACGAALGCVSLCLTGLLWAVSTWPSARTRSYGVALTCVNLPRTELL